MFRSIVRALLFAAIPSFAAALQLNSLALDRSVPEPGTLFLTVIGLTACAAPRWRRQTRANSR
jgi:hypothetical protein